MIEQILLTRFNVYNEEYFSVDGRNFENWCADRVQKFKTVCLPSVIQAHERADFRWIILFDQESPQVVTELIMELMQQAWIYPIFVPRNTNISFAALPLIKAAVHAITRDDTDYIITTRLDNDDAIHSRYMEAVLWNARKIIKQPDIQYPHVLDFEVGTSFDSKEVRVFTMSKISMFLNLIEKRADGVLSAFAKSHSTINDHYQTTRIRTNEPLWMMHCHSNNWLNKHKISGQLVQEDKLATLYHNFALDQNFSVHKALDHVRASTTDGEVRPPRDKTLKDYREVIGKLHEILKPERYLEIGVHKGDTIRLSKCRTHGIDPFPMLRGPLEDNVILHEMTSDDFFESEFVSDIDKHKIDYAFIDGMHLFDYVLRDFMNVERYAKPSSVVLFHDILPPFAASASRERLTDVWVGDVWKIILCLQEYRPDLKLTTVNAEPTGLLVAENLSPSSRVLADKYDEILAKYLSKPIGNLNDWEVQINPVDPQIFLQEFIKIRG